LNRKERVGKEKIESRWTTIGDLRIHAHVSAGPSSVADDVTVVLVHGLAVPGLYMLPTAERLAPFYRVLVPDLPGFGRSDKPAETLNVMELAGALGAWMEAENCGRAILIGNSLGCQVIVELATRFPQLVAGLVLTGPTVDPAGRTLMEQFKRLLIDATRERPSLLLIQLRGLFAAGLKRVWQTSKYALAYHLEERLPFIRAPALVVCGERDPLVPQAWAEQVARLLPNGRLAIIPGAPHALNYSAPDELAGLIREFIDRVVSPG
jgi:2-hydroxy-6-oxonona-2,4-dienedioate hydrolase